MRLLSFNVLAFLSAWSLLQAVHCAPAGTVDFFRHPAKLTRMPSGESDHGAIELTDPANKVWKVDDSTKARFLAAGSDYVVGDEVTFVQKLQTSADTAYAVHKMWNTGKVTYLNKGRSIVGLEDSRSMEQIYCATPRNVLKLTGIKVGSHVKFMRQGTATGEDVAYRVEIVQAP